MRENLRQGRARAAAWAFAALIALSGCATTKAERTYLIKIEKGDTLASIAGKYDTTWDKISKLNGLAPGASLQPGTVIRVQPGPGGIVAGATPAPRSRKAGAKPGVGETASAEEFDDADFPDEDGKRRGLLYGGASGASLRWPVNGELSSMFGKRGRRQHQGVDIRAPRGTEIRAAAPGVVEFAGTRSGYGRLVIIRHDRYKTAYAHMARVSVEKDQPVTHATVIGTVGTSGNATGPHLHFETRTHSDVAFDPLTLLRREMLLSQAAE